MLTPERDTGGKLNTGNEVGCRRNSNDIGPTTLNVRSHKEMKELEGLRKWSFSKKVAREMPKKRTFFWKYDSSSRE